MPENFNAMNSQQYARVEDSMSASRAAASFVLSIAMFVLTAVPVASPGAEGPGAVGPWPQWRGPNRDNISTETGLLKEWPKGGPPLAWKAHGIGGGFSTVSIADGKIFTMGDAADACYVFALDMEGKILWKTKVGPIGGGGGYAGPRCTPTISGKSVVALGQFGDLVCLETADGKLRWRTNLEHQLQGQMMSGWGYAESPLIDQDHVICTPGGRQGTMAALDLRTGAIVWRSKELTDQASYASPIQVEIDGRRQYIQLTNEHVVGIAADTGKLLWKGARRGETAVIPTPVFKNGEVFVTSGYNAGCNLFKITASSGNFSAKQVYANAHMSVHHGGVILLGDYIYGSADPGILTCMDFKTGKLKWKDRSVGKGSLTCADGKLYLRAESGTVALVEATPDGYHPISQFDQPDRSDANAWPHPVIADGKLYLRDQDLLLCYDVKQK